VSITTDEARALVVREIRRIVPDADVEGLAPGTDLRRALELDSLDFLGLVELVCQDTGLRIDDEDYPALTSLDAWVEFLTARDVARTGDR
jgi:acyl carrier protein